MRASISKSFRFIRKPSLCRDFSILCAVIIIAMIGLSLSLALNTYRAQSLNITQKMENQADRINRITNDVFNHGFFILDTVKEQISNVGNDPQKILSILVSFRDNQYGFGWSDTNMHLQLGSISGLVQKPVDISDRRYIQEVHNNPTKSYLGEPIESKPSGRKVVPLATGVYDAKHRFIGVVATHVQISALTTKFEQALNVDGINVALLNNHHETITQVLSSNGSDESLATFEKVKRTDFSHMQEGVFQQPGLLGLGSDFSFFHKSEKYPFTIVLTYDKNLAMQSIWGALLPRLLEILLVGGVLIAMLTLVRRRIITPVQQLSTAATNIFYGKKFTLPSKGPAEIRNLSDHVDRLHELSKIQGSIMRQRIRKARERKQEALVEAVAQAETEAEVKDKTQYLAGISHELRTPLNAIINFSEIIGTEMYGPMAECHVKYKEYAHDINASAAHLLTIVNNILDVAKADAGMLELQESVLDVKEMLQDCLKMVGEETGDKFARVCLNIPKPLPRISADPTRLRQIVINLLSNAMKFTPKDGLITLYAGVEADDVVIRVRDTGVGMRPEDVPQALLRFGQIKNPYSNASNGTGLGLPLSKELAELHGGKLTMESDIGAGTVVSVFLPAERIVQPSKPSLSLVVDNERHG